MCLSDKIGEINYNKYGEEMKIIEYNKANNIIVEFVDTKFKRKTSYSKFKEGMLLSPYSKTVYGIGYLGEFYNYKGVSKLKAYSYWRNMIKRCYCKKALETQPSYKIVSVCKEWHNFENFKTWFDLHYYNVKNDLVCLDKDIKNKNSFMYSPNTCIFIPNRINVIFEKLQREKASNRNNLPLGVLWIEADKIYGCRCRDNGKNIWLGRSHDINELFERYKQYKMKVIKDRLQEYDEIPDYVKDIVLSYEIEITD